MRTTRGINAVLNENTFFQTEGIRYSGSKRGLIPFIYEVIKELPVATVLDGFSGSTRVSQFFKRAGYSVHANDLAIYSSVLASTYLLNNDTAPKETLEKLAYLNQLAPVEGFFTEHYGGDDDGQGNIISTDRKKKPLQRKNARKLDAIRPEIDKICAGELEKNILLTALVLGLDRVENTLGHQVAYLARWASRSYGNLCLEAPRFLSSSQPCCVTQADVATLTGRYDLAYLDPPYNTNNPITLTTRVRYASYYHFWTTVIKNDQPVLVGASNRRKDCSSDRIPGAVSAYESIHLDVVEREFVQLLGKLDARFVLISYSNKGKLPISRMVELLSALGRICVTTIDHRENVQKILTLNKNWLGDASQNLEYLFLLERG